MCNKKAIMFDCYGTLYIYGDLKKAWNDWAETFAATLSRYHDIDKGDILHSLDGLFSKPKPDIILEENSLFEQRIWDHLISIGITPTKEMVVDIAESTIKIWHEEISFDPQVPSVLSELSKKHKLALLSNFDHPRQIKSMLDRDGIDMLFSNYFISGEIGFDKPDKRIFEHAMKCMSLKNEDVLYVGDSEEDYLGCKNSNIDFVLISRNLESRGKLSNDYRNDTTTLENDWTKKYNNLNIINSLSELPKILELHNG